MAKFSSILFVIQEAKKARRFSGRCFLPQKIVRKTVEKRQQKNDKKRFLLNVVVVAYFFSGKETVFSCRCF